MATQLKTQSRTSVGNPKGAPPGGQPQFIYSYWENAKLKTKGLGKGLVKFCFPELKLKLNHCFGVFSDIKLDLNSSIIFQVISSEMV